MSTPVMETWTALVGSTNSRLVPFSPLGPDWPIGSAAYQSRQEPSAFWERTKAAMSRSPVQVTANMENSSSRVNSLTVRGPGSPPWAAMAASSTTTLSPEAKDSVAWDTSMGPEPASWVWRIWLPPNAAVTTRAMDRMTASVGLTLACRDVAIRRRCCTMGTPCNS